MCNLCSCCTDSTSPIFCICIYFRLPTSLSSPSGTEFGRITFEFETLCTADCELYFMMVRTAPGKCLLLHTILCRCLEGKWVAFIFQDVNRKTTTVVESWVKTKARQSYTHIMTKNASVSYTWAFQRTNQPSDVSTRTRSLSFIYLPPVKCL